LTLSCLFLDRVFYNLVLNLGLFDIYETGNVIRGRGMKNGKINSGSKLSFMFEVLLAADYSVFARNFI